MPLPWVSAVLAAVAEFGGGLSLLTGLLFRWVMIPLSFTMFVAAFSAHSGFGAQHGGMEYPLTLAVLAAGLALIGPGRIAISWPKKG